MAFYKPKPGALTALAPNFAKPSSPLLAGANTFLAKAPALLTPTAPVQPQLKPPTSPWQPAPNPNAPVSSSPYAPYKPQPGSSPVTAPPGGIQKFIDGVGQGPFKGDPGFTRPPMSSTPLPALKPKPQTPTRPEQPPQAPGTFTPVENLRPVAPTSPIRSLVTALNQYRTPERIIEAMMGQPPIRAITQAPRPAAPPSRAPEPIVPPGSPVGSTALPPQAPADDRTLQSAITQAPGAAPDLGLQQGDPAQIITDQTGAYMVEIEGYGQISVADAERFARDFGGGASFGDILRTDGVEAATANFEQWLYNQWNGPELRLAPYLGYKVEGGTEWVVLPDGRGQWDVDTAERVAGALGYESIGQMFQSVNNFDQAVTMVNDFLYDEANPGTWDKISGFIFGQAIGVPYVWGGGDLNGFDCSGFVLWAFGTAGISIGARTADGQFRSTQRVSGDQLQPGDLVFWDWGGDGVIDHVEIYIGNGQIVGTASDTRPVGVRPINTFGSPPTGYGRVL